MAKRKVEDPMEFSEATWRQQYADTTEEWQRCRLLYLLCEVPPQHALLASQLWQEHVQALSSRRLVDVLRHTPETFLRHVTDQRIQRHWELAQHLDRMDYYAHSSLDFGRSEHALVKIFEAYNDAPELQTLVLERLCRDHGRCSNEFWKALLLIEPRLNDELWTTMKTEVLKGYSEPDVVFSAASPRLRALLCEVLVKSHYLEQAIAALLQSQLDPLVLSEVHPLLKKLATYFHQLYRNEK